MKVYHNFSETTGQIKNAVVTTGSFDGVHVGHKIIIGRLNEIARNIGGESVLVTFHPHPRKVLFPDQREMKLINSQDEKIELLRKAGLDHLVIIPFSLDFSKTSSHEFVTRMLVEQLGVRVVVVGQGHHFGHGRQGDYSYLHRLSRELNFDVEEIPLKDIENETVSSTKIRKAIDEGNVQRANAYLDHQYIIRGPLRVAEPFHPNFPCLSMDILAEEKLAPPPGIYAGNLFFDDDWMKCMIIICKEGLKDNRVYFHLIYDNLEPLGQEATLYFYKSVWLRKDDNASLSMEVLNSSKEMIEDLIY